MSLFTDFATNKTKETEGVVVTYAPNADGTVPSFRIARISPSNKRYVKAMERITRPWRRQIDLELIDNAFAEELNKKVFVEVILLGFDNIQPKDDGEVMLYSQENATKLFETMPDLYFDLKAQAMKAATFRDEVLEVEAKN